MNQINKTNENQEYINKFQYLFDFPIQKFEIIRFKDGILVIRVIVNNQSFVIKHFENEQYAREIEIYKLLNELNIKTLKILKTTNKTLVMEDINASVDYKLATQKDLQNDNVLKNLAKWYKQLHNAGKNLKLENFYCENDYITLDNIKKLKNLLNEEQITLLLSNFNKINEMKNENDYTITYNDFATENLVIGKNCAFMFDYNLVGKGNPYADIMNVCAMLDDSQKVKFMKYYGEKFTQQDKNAQFILGTLYSLIIANQREIFPTWANSLVDTIKSQKFNNILNNWIK